MNISFLYFDRVNQGGSVTWWPDVLTPLLDSILQNGRLCYVAVLSCCVILLAYQRAIIKEGPPSRLALFLSGCLCSGPGNDLQMIRISGWLGIILLPVIRGPYGGKRKPH